MDFLDKETVLEVESYRFENVNLSGTSSEGRQMARCKSVPITEIRNFPAGSTVICMNQACARLIAHALEPNAPSSFVAWVFFNSIFQRTKYFENYAKEALARQMLENDPALKKPFEEENASDSAFASNPRAIQNWFYEQSPYVDQKHNIYQVGRLVKRQGV